MEELNKEVSMENLNKKEKVVCLAKYDPFLKVEELATKVGTTPHYVRTVLSEAELSLTKLRREYAKKMEELSTSAINRLLVDVFNLSQLDEINQERLDRIILNDYQIYHQLIRERVYSQASSIIFTQQQPLVVNTLFWLDEEDVNNIEQTISEVLEDDSVKVKFSDLQLEIEETNYDLSEALEVSLNEPLFKFSRRIIVDDQLKGLDIFYLRSDDCQVSFSGKQSTVNIEYK
ncbi:MAG: hypothetical protein ACQEQI_08105 [Bacillota bacterium]